MGKDSREIIEAARARGAGGAHTITFDFSNTSFIDSAGIGVLVSLVKELRAHKTELVLCCLSDEIAELFAETGVDAIFTIETANGVQRGAADIFEPAIDIKLGVTTSIADDVCIMKLTGVMNHPAGSRLFKQRTLLVMAQARKICIDLSELTFFDSMSVGALLAMSKLLGGTGGALRLCCPNYIVKDLFVTLSIDAIIPVYDTRDKALADWGMADS